MSMRTPILRRVTAWLCLAAALLMSVSPTQALVLCLEPDGSFALELATADSACDGCALPATAADRTPSVTLAADRDCCACIDIPVSIRSDEDRLDVRRVEVNLAAPSLPLPIVVAVLPLAQLSQPSVLRERPPRPSSLLTLVRSVVLHV